MLRLKSVFITAFITLLMVSLGLSLYRISQQEWLWLGVTLSAAPGALFFGWLMLAQPWARTQAHFRSILLLKGAGFLGVAILASQTTDWSVNLLPLALSLGCALGWGLYDYWYSTFKGRSIRLTLGEPLPDLVFTLPDGAPFESESLHGAKALLIFYRGNWCPLCMAQIEEIAAEYAELARREVTVCLISPQSHANTQALAKRYKLPLLFLTDDNNRVARQLGISAEGGLPFGMQALGYASDTLMPTVVMIDAQGRVIFVDLTDNYRVRPEPATFLRILDQQT